MKIQATYKVCRRLGAGVFDKCQTQKYTLSEARRGKTMRGGRRRNVTDYGKQLLEKQRVRFAYGVSERQLRRYIEEANRAATLGTDPTVRLMEQLEMRLDNVVYRLGLAASRRAARQLVTHGHVHVNGKRTDIPSRQLREKDTVSVRERTQKLPIMDRMKETMDTASLPAWISFDKKKLEGTVTARPKVEVTEMPGNVGAILEYYSR